MGDDRTDSEWAMQLGNQSASLEPKNGLMKTYENPNRTFTRPYSAKTVYFYKEGDVFFTGVRIPISHHRYKTFESLLEDLNNQIYMPFGVRNITTPMGRTGIQSLDQLEHLGRYVASSSKPPRGVNIEEIEKMREKMSAVLRNQQTAGQPVWVIEFYRNEKL